MTRHPINELAPERLLVAPSVLAADFSKLGEELKRVEKGGCDLIHLDVMDGHFVPNLTFGPALVSAIRKVSNLTFDTHLMVSHPLNFVEPFAKAGSDHITFHVESEDNPAEVIAAIKAAGCSVGISLRPKTKAEALLPYLDKIDMVLIMTVEPGFGGQAFMHDMIPKIKTVKELVSKDARRVHIQVDGGIDMDTVSLVAAAGANVMVAGTSVFRSPAGADVAIAKLHAAQKALSRK